MPDVYQPIEVGREIISICVVQDGRAVVKSNQLVIGYCVVELQQEQTDGQPITWNVTLYTVLDLDDHARENVTAASIIRATPPKMVEE